MNGHVVTANGVKEVKGVTKHTWWKDGTFYVCASFLRVIMFIC